jgi:hypothetical protein
MVLRVRRSNMTCPPPWRGDVRCKMPRMCKVDCSSACLTMSWHRLQGGGFVPEQRHVTSMRLARVTDEARDIALIRREPQPGACASGGEHQQAVQAAAAHTFADRAISSNPQDRRGYPARGGPHSIDANAAIAPESEDSSQSSENQLPRQEGLMQRVPFRKAASLFMEDAAFVKSVFLFISMFFVVFTFLEVWTLAADGARLIQVSQSVEMIVMTFVRLFAPRCGRCLTQI